MTFEPDSAVAPNAPLDLPEMEGSGKGGAWQVLRDVLSSWPARISAIVLLLIVLMAVFAPFLGTGNPVTINPALRLQGSSAEHWLGTDSYGRDVYSRIVYGARISLAVGAGTVIVSLVLGIFFGVLTGYFKWADIIVMRFMDGLMAIPGILLAIALVAISGATLTTVLIAIAVPEIPRVARMVRSVILGVRNEPYVEAASILGTGVWKMVWRHMLPNTVAPLIVQGTYIFASAIMTESILSFLGAGVPPETPSWGNMMADGRTFFLLKPELILYPGVMVSLTVLSVNMLGDVLRDRLDPRMAKRL
ncbi:ABC transporter permease [Paenirhodobacter populi]|uniref:ABC transporter permease n=1 Tax=Paenirhodobacter populi TaxID=2306993 RepID=A0A443KI99_9RHOB|nr:ABC transporter permease [Sinirhodobacter populi]RWR11015.1 ABC transporter permease [Sinirhodobacter populi]RWR21090.1 ABC transporter permease [Sinirhodobacter populi]RWR32464.1 ABC transporter permease [Sinirhodobacter populi]